MANRHSLMWRAPERRNKERRKFLRLVREVETFRLKRQDGTPGLVRANLSGTSRFTVQT
jgi:hypothetical protein